MGRFVRTLSCSSEQFARTIPMDLVGLPALRCLGAMMMTRSSPMEPFHALFLLLAMTPTGDPPVSFDRDVRPILSNNCFECHGPDTNKRKAKLRLDLEEELFSLRGEAYVITPGEPLKSELFLRITDEDPEFRMPPTEFRHSLESEEIETIRRWIAEGAEYEGHWAWSRPTRPEPPAVQHEAWVRNPIDRFVLARLEAEGTVPSPAADTRTLARRLSVDLTGLPADPDAVADFVGGTFDEAAYVDELLGSPHYGERMAQHWLDLVRYADTVGYHGDQEWGMWPYRDYVIRSFNENKPFNEFTLDQLGGDLYDEPTMSNKVAAGYNRLNMVTFEGGSQAKEYLLKYAADRVRNFSTVWLGSTVGCAECHDHKFDPYATKDFYRLSAYFADIDEVGVFAGVGSVPPQMRVASPEQEIELAGLFARAERLKGELDRDDPELTLEQATWELGAASEADDGIRNSVAWVDDVQSNGGKTEGAWTFVGEADGAPVRSGERSRRQTGGAIVQHFFHFANKRIALTEGDRFYAWVHLDPANPPKQLMLQFHVDGTWEHRVVWGEDKISFGGVGTDKDGHRQMGALPVLGEWVRLEVDPALVGLGPGRSVDGMAYTQFGGLAHWDEAGVETDTPSLAFGSALGSVRDVVLTDAEARTEEQAQLLRAYYREISPTLSVMRSAIAEAEVAHTSFKDSLPEMLATVSVKPREVKVLPRGNWMDDSGEVVLPGVPAFLPQGEVLGTERADRLDLGRWAVSEANPLVARAFTNRIWKLLFGEGIARTPDDLGNQGARPTHPELLDWLSAEFIESGWNVKHLVRTIVESNTYRQRSGARADLSDRDPYNELLARQGRWRHDAEFLRDGALAASGLMTSAIGGKSVKPYQPVGHWRELNFPMRTWQQGDDLYRRGLYTFWCRTFLHPAMDAFDAPSREESCARRNRSNTPQQALVLLNDPTFVEAARTLAEEPARALADESDEQGVHHIWQRVLARPANAGELKEALSLLADERARFSTDDAAGSALLSKGERPVPADLSTAELAAWTQVARLVLNLHETVTRS